MLATKQTGFSITDGLILVAKTKHRGKKTK